MKELAEEFMDKWLDKNAGVEFDALTDVVIDIEDAIGDERKVRAARAAGK